MKLCRHCCKYKVNRPRGLCWRCYYSPLISSLYPSTSKFNRRHADRFMVAPLPEPTVARPGTPEKLAVLENRARLGQSLFHKRDAA